MIIEVKNLKKTYGGKVPTYALKDINFGIDKGEFIALMGRSGSGKSTLLHQLGLLDEPTAGEIIIDGIKEGGSFLLNSPWDAEETKKRLPSGYKKITITFIDKLSLFSCLSYKISNRYLLQLHK